MAAPESSKTDQPTGTLARLGSLAWQALPAIGGAIGVLGFVTLVGGAIVWVRFWSAGLPADQAVRAMPRQELITIGAVSLVAFAVAGVVMVLLLYLLDDHGSASRRTFLGLSILAVLEWWVTLLVFTEVGRWEWALAAWFAIAAVIAYRALGDAAEALEASTLRRAGAEPLRAAWREFRAATDRRDDAQFRKTLTPDAPPPHWPAEYFRRAAVDCLHQQREWARALDRWTEELSRGSKAAAAAKALPRDNPPAETDLEAAIALAVEEAQAAAGLTGPRTFWRSAWAARRSWIALGVMLIAVIVLLASTPKDDQIILAAVAVIIVVLAVGNFAVAWITKGFAWYGATALASLILFGAGANIVKTVREPQVQPVAFVRKSDGVAFCGVYVTETDKRLYVGRVQGDTGEAAPGADGGAGRMFWIPLDDVEVSTVGPIQDMEDANWRARFLVAEVRGDRPVKPPASPRMEKRTVTEKDTRKRREGLVTTTTTVEDVPADTAGEPKPQPKPAAPSVASRPKADMQCWRRDITQARKPK